jgi:hypothetical protein
MSAYIKFIDKIPPADIGFAFYFLIQGVIYNDFLSDMVSNEWHFVSVVGKATNGDNGWILYFFGDMEGP